MFSKNKPKSEVDIAQHELLENAQKRIKQKKRLFSHFVVFLIGSVFIVLINKIFNQWDAYDWYIWAISAWACLFLIHAFNVFITHKFMGKDWERKQREKLVAKQKAKISEIQREIETDFPISNFNKKKVE
jgi:uncharacterized membrane protein YcjF (UPF0283 family)